MLMPYKSCLCTPWSCHPYFILQFCFLYLFLLFFIALNIIVIFINAILYGLLIQLSYGVIKWLVHRRYRSFLRARKVLAMPFKVADKEGCPGSGVSCSRLELSAASVSDRDWLVTLYAAMLHCACRAPYHRHMISPWQHFLTCALYNKNGVSDTPIS